MKITLTMYQYFHIIKRFPNLLSNQLVEPNSAPNDILELEMEDTDMSYLWTELSHLVQTIQPVITAIETQFSQEQKNIRMSMQ